MSDDVRKPGALASSLRLVLVLVVCGLLVEGLRLPSSVPETAPATEFSEARARKHLEAVAFEIHPTGSVANQRVRLYLEGTLKSLGLDVEVQTGEVAGTRVENVIGKLPGEFQDRGVLLFACHYDSVHRGATSRSPGAGDDGAAVASFLEAARALRAGPPLPNDVWFLFTDGEELGLCGAELFRREHEAFGRIDAVFNFEAIGNRGPSIMFETRPGNARLIEEFARIGVPIVAPSVGPAIYEHMPNDTDFSVFKEGFGGLNFAIVGGNDAYHRPWDTPDNLTPGTLQFQGDTVLALARHFGSMTELDLESDEDRVFFDVLGLQLIHYPVVGGYGLVALVLLVTGMAFARGVKRKAYGRATLFLGPLLAVVGGLLCGAAAFGMARSSVPFGELLNGGVAADADRHGDALSASFAGVGMVAAALALGLSLLKTIDHGPRGPGLVCRIHIGACLLWALLGVVTVVLVPLGSYLFHWPLLGCALAAFPYGRAKLRERESGLAALLCLPGLVLLLPTLGLLMRLVSKEAGVMLVVGAVGVGLAAPLFLPLCSWTRARGALPLMLAWFGAACLCTAFGWLRAAGY